MKAMLRFPRYFVLTLCLIFVMPLLSCANQSVKTGDSGIQGSISVKAIADTIAEKNNWMDQAALAALFATYKKNQEGGKTPEKITANFTDPSCIKTDSSNSQDQWNDLVNKIKEKELKSKAKDAALKGFSGLDEKQRQEAFKLLISGRANEDIKQSIIATLKEFKNINPSLLITTTKNVLNGSHQLSYIEALYEDLRTPGILSHSMMKIKSEPLGLVITDTLRIFLNPQNRTMRLAILAYAHMNGINITEDNLDDLYAVLGDNPDLTPLLVGLVDTMKQEYGINDIEVGLKQAKEKIDEIQQNENSCR